MNYKELIDNYNKFFLYIRQKQLKDAFDTLKKLVNVCLNKDLKIQFDNYFYTYSNMLKYTFELTNDPEKEKVLQRMLKSLTELADEVKEDIISTYNLLGIYSQKKLLEKNSLTSTEDSDELVDSLEFSHEFQQMLQSDSVNLDSNIKSATYKSNLITIFKLIWFTDKFKEAETVLVNKICLTKSIPWYDKSILVSALTLSLFRHYDSKKIMLLLDFYEYHENYVWQRALIGVVLGLFYYDERLKYYPEILNRLKTMQGNKELISNLENIIIQFIKAKETEKITKKIREEIMPEVLKMRSKFEEKLDLDNILSIKSFEDKNPEWENFFKDSPNIYNKFEEFSNLQIEGSDVFLSAFAMLKHFDFFNEITNWFLPFYKENEIVIQALDNVKEDLDIGQFTEGLEKSTFMCNSDKYSFCLNVKHLPSVQKSMMTELLNMELKAMNEMSEDDALLNKESVNKSITTQYFQDLYRFHKLYPLKNEFIDIYEMNFDIYNASFFRILVEEKKLFRNLAEFLFEKNYYQEALDLFLDCALNDKNYELYEKIAYCYQQTGSIREALEYYKKAELLDENSLWIYHKIAWCYRKLKNYDEAIQYYLKAEKLKPDDLNIVVMLGQTHMEKEDFENALKNFFKVEYIAPDNQKVLRPIAWCSFVLGKFDVAKKYLEKTIQKEGNKHDYLNMGHLEWSMGNRQEAINNYKQSIKKSDFDFTWFSKVIEEDKKYLLKNGVNMFDIPLMIDYLKIFRE